MSRNILLCISDTGGGHRSAANAIRKAIDELTQHDSSGHTYEVVITDVVRDSNGLHWLFVALYNFLLSNKQSWMKYYYWLIERLKPNDSALGYWLASGYLKRLLQRIDPVVIVSLHPMANHYLARAIKSWKPDSSPDLIVVVTDPNASLWTGWACHEASLIISPNQLATQRLLALKILPDRIKTIGMPVDPEYLRPAVCNREQFFKGLNLDPNLITVCLSAGWAGGGNMLKIYRAMAGIGKPFQTIVLCGNNVHLYNLFKQRAGAMKFKTLVIPKLPSLSDAMNACDLLVTKAGGLTTYEAVARRVPMAIDMLTAPMPQERGTAEMLIEVGLAKPLKKQSDIVAIVEGLERLEDRYAKVLPVKYNLDHTDAVYDIAKIILSSAGAE